MSLSIRSSDVLDDSRPGDGHGRTGNRMGTRGCWRTRGPRHCFAGGRGPRGGPSCRSRGTPRRRAVRLAGTRGCGHGDRSRLDRHVDDQWRRRDGDPGARYGVRRRNDHVQWHRRFVDPVRRIPSLGRIVQRRRLGRSARHCRDTGDARHGRAQLHDQQAGAGVFAGAARIRSGDRSRSVWIVRGTAGGTSPRLLSAGHCIRRCSRSGRACRTAAGPNSVVELGPAAGCAGGSRWQCEAGVADDRAGRDRSGAAAVGGRRDHRTARIAARDTRRGTRRSPSAAADQSQPCLRFGHGQHRSDHSRRSRLPRSGCPCRCILASARCTSSCWP